MRLVFALFAVFLTAAGASADVIRSRTVTVTRSRSVVQVAPVVVRQAPVVVQSAPVVVQQAAPVIVRQAAPVVLQAPAVYAAPAVQFAPACAGGACLSPSQAAALRAAQLRALGY